MPSVGRYADNNYVMEKKESHGGVGQKKGFRQQNKYEKRGPNKWKKWKENNLGWIRSERRDESEV